MENFFMTSKKIKYYRDMGHDPLNPQFSVKLSEVEFWRLIPGFGWKNMDTFH